MGHTAARSLVGIAAPLLMMVGACDLLKKGGGGGGAEGLPSECSDYLAVYECTLTKGGAPNAHETAEQVRASYKAMAASITSAQRSPRRAPTPWRAPRRSPTRSGA